MLIHLANEIYQAIAFGSWFHMVLLMGLGGFLVVFMSFLSRSKEYQEYNITGFCLIYYICTLCCVCYGQQGYLNDPTDAFYVGYAFSAYEMIVIGRMPKFRHKVFFVIMAMLTRLILAPPKGEITPFVIQAVMISFKLYLESDKETQSRELFRGNFNSQDQYDKFKNLVAHEIPQSIAIVKKNLQSFLFVNDSWKRLLKLRDSQEEEEGSICCLEKFILQEGEEEEGNPRNAYLSRQNLLNFIKRKFTYESNNNKKLSCFVNFSEEEGSQKRVFNASLTDIIWDNEPSVVIVLKDVTEHQSINSLKVADAQKDNVLATVSHELRTPLNGILGMIQVIEKKIYDQEILHYLSICKSSGNLLLSLVNSILDLNQIRANKLKLYCEKIDVNKLLTSVMALFDFQCTQKGIYLKTRMSHLTPDFIYSDKNRLSQILINLVGNALKFTFKGGITLSAAVSEDGSSIQYLVEDTGIGIKAEDKEKLFKIFGRLDNEDEKINHQGVGLGLMISNNLAKLLCDKQEFKGIRVESEYGKGSSFSFFVNKRHGIMRKESFKAHYGDESLEEGDTSLTDKLNSYSNKKKNNSKMSSPLKSDEEGEERKFLFKNIRPLLLPRLASSPDVNYFKLRTEPNSATNGSSLFKPRISECSPLILIVDDNPFNVTVAEHMLAALNFQVKSALSGDACIQFLASHDQENDPIKLILMDCQMPLMDGYETTRILKKKMKENKIPEIPIVALTANDTELDKEECKKVGMCDYLSKPLNENKLKRMIKRYVD